MGRDHGVLNRRVKKADAIAAFKKLGFTLVESTNKKRILKIQSVPQGIKPDRPLTMHYDDRGSIRMYEIDQIARTLRIDMETLGLG